MQSTFDTLRAVFCRQEYFALEYGQILPKPTGTNCFVVQIQTVAAPESALLVLCGELALELLFELMLSRYWEAWLS